MTVTVAFVELSATTEAGAAETVEVAALTGPVVNETVGACVIVTPSVVSVAV